MKIKYIGTKQRMSVTLPVGFGRQAQKGVLHFAPNDIHEMSEFDGTRLLEFNKAGGYFVQVDDLVPTSVKSNVENIESKKRGRPKKED